MPSSEAESQADGADSDSGGDGVPERHEQASEGAGDSGSTQPERQAMKYINIMYSLKYKNMVQAYI